MDVRNIFRKKLLIESAIKDNDEERFLDLVRKVPIGPNIKIKDSTIESDKCVGDEASESGSDKLVDLACESFLSDMTDVAFSSDDCSAVAAFPESKNIYLEADIFWSLFSLAIELKFMPATIYFLLKFIREYILVPTNDELTPYTLNKIKNAIALLRGMGESIDCHNDCAKNNSSILNVKKKLSLSFYSSDNDDFSFKIFEFISLIVQLVDNVILDSILPDVLSCLSLEPNVSIKKIIIILNIIFLIDNSKSNEFLLSFDLILKMLKNGWFNDIKRICKKVQASCDSYFYVLRVLLACIINGGFDILKSYNFFDAKESDLSRGLSQAFSTWLAVCYKYSRNWACKVVDDIFFNNCSLFLYAFSKISPTMGFLHLPESFLIQKDFLNEIRKELNKLMSSLPDSLPNVKEFYHWTLRSILHKIYKMDCMIPLEPSIIVQLNLLTGRIGCNLYHIYNGTLSHNGYEKSSQSMYNCIISLYMFFYSVLKHSSNYDNIYRFLLRESIEKLSFELPCLSHNVSYYPSHSGSDAIFFALKVFEDYTDIDHISFMGDPYFEIRASEYSGYFPFHFDYSGDKKNSDSHIFFITPGFIYQKKNPYSDDDLMKILGGNIKGVIIDLVGFYEVNSNILHFIKNLLCPVIIVHGNKFGFVDGGISRVQLGGFYILSHDEKIHAVANEIYLRRLDKKDILRDATKVSRLMNLLLISCTWSFIFNRLKAVSANVTHVLKITQPKTPFFFIQKKQFRLHHIVLLLICHWSSSYTSLYSNCMTDDTATSLRFYISAFPRLMVDIYSYIRKERFRARSFDDILHALKQVNQKELNHGWSGLTVRSVSLWLLVQFINMRSRYVREPHSREFRMYKGFLEHMRLHIHKIVDTNGKYIWSDTFDCEVIEPWVSPIISELHHLFKLKALEFLDNKLKEGFLEKAFQCLKENPGAPDSVCCSCFLFWTRRGSADQHARHHQKSTSRTPLLE